MSGQLDMPEPVSTFGRREKFLDPAGNQTLDCPTCRLVTIPITQSSHAKYNVYVQTQKAGTLKINTLSDFNDNILF
jgi:hypothetical protein